MSINVILRSVGGAFPSHPRIPWKIYSGDLWDPLEHILKGEGCAGWVGMPQIQQPFLAIADVPSIGARTPQDSTHCEYEIFKCRQWWFKVKNEIATLQPRMHTLLDISWLLNPKARPIARLLWQLSATLTVANWPDNKQLDLLFCFCTTGEASRRLEGSTITCKCLEQQRSRYRWKNLATPFKSVSLKAGSGLAQLNC